MHTASARTAANVSHILFIVICTKEDVTELLPLMMDTFTAMQDLHVITRICVNADVVIVSSFSIISCIYLSNLM